MAAALLTSCIDDNYDLSNIDTSVRVDVNDLVVPVNVGAVSLNSVIDIEDSENISKEPYTGTNPALQGKEIFVFHQKGDFTSDEIHINPFHVNAPTGLNPTVVDVKRSSLSAADRKGRRAGAAAGVIEYDIKDVATKFNYHIDGIDNKVTEIDDIETPKVTLSTTLSLDQAFRNTLSNLYIEDLQIQFPKSLEMKANTPAQASIGTYDSKTGIATIDKADIEGNSITLTIEAKLIDLLEAGATLSDGSIDYTGDINVLSGKLYLEPEANVIPPEEFQMDVDYDLSSFDISSFSGTVDYDIEDLAFDDVELNNLPDFLSQDETSLRIANPQLYISIYNTCAEYGLKGFTGFEITPMRGNVASSTLVLPAEINVGDNNGVGPYKYAISPEGSALTPIGGYENAEKLAFPGLSDVLYGEGLPSTLKVEFSNPHMNGTTKNFPLSRAGSPENIEGVHGEYEFRAPLALADGSVIAYSGTEEDWDSEALEDLHIGKLELTALATSDVPLNVELSARLIDKNGRHIGVCDETILEANAKDQEFTLTIRPAEVQEELTGINGIYYSVKAIAPEGADNPSDVTPLSPEQTIQLNNIRAKINGYYLHLDKDDK